MRHLICVLLFFSLEPTVIIAHQKLVEYQYNRNGDRIMRQVIMMIAPKVRSTESILSENENPVLITDYFENREIHIFPNPTKGCIKVEIIFTGWKTEDNSENQQKIDLFLYDSTGKQVFQQQSTGISFLLDLSDYPAGWYILQLSVGNSRKEYKIIKE